MEIMITANLQIKSLIRIVIWVGVSLSELYFRIMVGKVFGRVLLWSMV